MPDTVNGIAIESWTNHPQPTSEWKSVAGQCAGLVKPALGMMSAAGAVIVESDGRIWLIAPTNAFGGYINTFPKGGVERGTSLQATAIKKAYDVAGLRIEITGFVCDIVHSTTVTRYYLARRIGGNPADMCWESQSVHLVPLERLSNYLNNQHEHLIVESLFAMKVRESRDVMLSDIMLQGGGDLVRVRTAIAEFFALYGHWPTAIGLGHGTLDSLKNHHLSLIGYKLLYERIPVTPQLKEHQILVVDTLGNEYDYGQGELTEVDCNKTDMWIWGVYLD
jgi:ADP-ribose pyrophosphatase YjhB (NUDIX family)